jgi:hypothetical protein
MLPKYGRSLKSFLLSSFICSQIWIIPIVDDQQCGYNTKLRREKKNPAPNLDVKNLRLSGLWAWGKFEDSHIFTNLVPFQLQ